MIYASQDDRKLLERRSLDAAQHNTEPSKTQQGPAHDCDINNIAKAFGLSGKNAFVPPEVFDPQYYADLSEAPDLQTALNLVRDAENQFMRLPAELRRRFNDSPVTLWNFVQDPANAQMAVELGLLKAPPPIVVPGANTAVSAEAETA